jgi:aspartate racemase
MVVPIWWLWDVSFCGTPTGLWRRQSSWATMAAGPGSTAAPALDMTAEIPRQPSTNNRRKPMHKRIGILGGMSPESTAAYYETITRTYAERFGDYGYPEIIIYSVSFQQYVDWPNAGRWDLVADGLSAAAQKLVAAGADLILIATNTMHLVFDEVQARVPVPMVSLLDAVGDAVGAQGMETVGLLGTRFTMEQSFYPDALSPRGITVLTPDAPGRAYVNRIIYEELVAGKIRDESRREFVRIIHELRDRGAQGVILGCTEIPLLVTEADAGLPLFDTTTIHAEAALQVAIDEA